MKQKISFGLGLAVVALLVLPSLTHAADNWWFEDSVGSSGAIYAEDFSSGNGFISGASGFVAKTSDYGKSWTDISTGTSSILGVVYYGGDAYAVGASGVLKKYTTSTSSWSTLSSGTTSTLNDIAGYSTYIYAVGSSGAIVRSTNSGSSFSALTPITTSTLTAVSQSGAEFWAVGNNGTLLRKSVSSTTFSAVSSGTSVALYGVDVYYKTGSPTVWISGFGGLLKKSTDGGTTWETLTIPGVGAAESIYDIDFQGDYGVATASGRIYFTDDGGDTWDEVDYGDADTGSIIYDIGISTNGSDYFMRAAGYNGFFVFEDSVPVAPSALTVSGGSPTTDTTPEFTWTAASDSFSTLTYTLTLDGASNDPDPITFVASSSATWPTALSDDAYAVSLVASDQSGNTSSAATASFTVDTTGPTVTPMFSDGQVGEAYTILAMTGDMSGVSSCQALVEGEVEAFEMTFQGALLMWAGAFVPTVAGDLEILVECEDVLGHIGQGRAAVTFAAADTGDTTAPSVSIVTPTGWVERYVTTAVIATVTDDVGVTRCDLYNNGSYWESMTISGESATVTTEFEDSAASITVRCADTSGNLGISMAVALEVLSEQEATARESADEEDESTEDTGDDSSTDSGSGSGSSSSGEASSGSGSDETALIADDEAVEGTLIKLACDNTQEVGVNDPCKAVYFYGSEGKRHAFPNEKVFYTWYDNFDDVVVVSGDYLSDISLGSNVTYHPGTRMVKFQSVPTVYAVSLGGVLRAIVSEDVATDLYGSTWNQQIDDISDAFFGNYSFGEDIDSAGDYDIDEEEASADTIDDSLAE